MKKWTAIVPLVLLAIAACGSTGGSTSSVPIKIGVPVPLSGSLAAEGQDLANAAQLAASDVNKGGGVLGGRKLQIVTEDDQCEAQVGVQSAEKLVLEKVAVFAGGLCSGAAIPESGVARSHGDIPFVSPTASNVKFTEQGYDNVFRMYDRDDQQGPADASYLYNQLGAKNIAIVHDGTTYVKGLAQSVADAFKSMGGTVVYFDALTPGQQDYTSVLTKVSSHSPDAFYYPGYYPEFSLLIKQYAQQNLTFKLVSGGGSGVDPTVIKVAGASAENPNITMTTAPGGPFLENAAKYNADYKKMFNQDAGAAGAYEYDAIRVIAAAINRAGSTSAKQLNNALRKTHYDGLTGAISFDDKGDRPAFTFLAVRDIGGEFKIIAKESGANKWTSV